VASIIHKPLLSGVTQYEVDFVIPRIGVDLPIGIDPFLLFKSRDTALADVHREILAAFNHGVALVRDKQLDRARAVFDFPEVSEIGFGYSVRGKRGAGLGHYLGELIVQTLVDSPPLLERGIRHIEEMQLVSLGMGPDRLSDIAANLLKRYLLDYTRRQCRLWNINMVTAPVEHVYDLDAHMWFDGYEELPVSPVDGTPIILVPRRIVRTLPWINYQDFLRSEFSAYLRAKRVREHGSSSRLIAAPSPTEKEVIAGIARRDVEHIDRYVAAKEAAAPAAQPTGDYVEHDGICPEADALAVRTPLRTSESSWRRSTFSSPPTSLMASWRLRRLTVPNVATFSSRTTQTNLFGRICATSTRRCCSCSKSRTRRRSIISISTKSRRILAIALGA